MALIWSAQSGDWDESSTWVGGTVPDLSVDDVIIAGGHGVTMDWTNRTLTSGREITVEQYATLEVYYELTVENGASLYVDGGLYVSAYINMQGYMVIGGDGWLDDYGSVAVVYGGTVDAYGAINVGAYCNFDLVYGSSLHVYGSFYQDYSANVYVYQGSNFTVEAGGDAYFNGYLYVEDYAQFHAYGDMDIDYSGSVDVRYYGEFHVEPGGSLTNNNYVYVTDSGVLYVHGDMANQSSLYIAGSGQVYVENGGTLTVDGYVQVEYYSTLTMSYGGSLIVRPSGSVDTYYDGTIYFDYQSRSDIFGYFGLSHDAYLYIGSDALIRVYRDIHVSGRMESDGGKIVMMRREGRINEYYGDPLFVFDQAYGHGQTLIA